MATTKSATTVDQDDVIPDYVVRRTFKFKGHEFHRGDPITVSVYQHKRFDALVNTGLIKAVLR